MGDDDLPGRLDPFTVFRDARVGADGLNDGARRDNLDFIDPLDEIFEGKTHIALAAGEEASGVGVAIDGAEVSS